MVATVSANVGHYRAHNEDKSRSEKAKVLHWSRQLQMRLQYAKLKVEHGWTKQSLNEVENLYFRHSHKRGRPLQPAPTLSTTTASYSNESFTNVDTQNAPVNQSVLSFRSNLARQPTLPDMPAAGNSTVATTSSKSPSPQAISPLAPSPFPADALPTRSTPSIRVSPPPATKPQETSKPQMPWPSPTLTPKRLPPTTSKAPTSLAELFPSQTLTYDSFWSTHTSARGGFTSRGSMGNVGVMNGGLDTALPQQIVELEALSNFTANDAIVNGLHISNGSVPAELASLLAIVCRARRPSSPASYIRDSTIRTIEEAAFLIKEGNAWNIFGEDADAYPVRTSDELVHYDRLGTFIRLTSLLAVPPAETFKSGSVAAHFHSQIQSIISWDYEGELEFAVDAAYLIDMKIVHPDGDPVKYSMKGDFFVRTCDEKIPFLFGGVDSNCDLDDKFRMLLLVYSFMKLWRSVALPFTLTPLAIFLDKELIAETHIFYLATDAEIRCHRIDYDLKSHKSLAHFVLFLRNYLDTMKPLWTDHAKLQKLRQAIDAVRVEIGHLVSHRVSLNDGEDDNEPSDGGIGRIDCDIAKLDTPTDTWQRLLTNRRAILVTKQNKPILVAKIVEEEEWTILNRLQGVPGVVSITRHHALPDDFHLVLMPWMGCSIDGYLYFTRNPSPDSRLVALSFLRSLSRIHSRRIAHLDLKLTNVRVAIDDVSDGTVSIIDFGHSAILDNDSNFIEGETGTYGWSAPEVMSGEPYDAFFADTWSAGRIISYYAAHGPPQSVDKWLEDLGHDMQAEEPKNRTALSTAIRCLELDAENRRATYASL